MAKKKGFTGRLIWFSIIMFVGVVGYVYLSKVFFKTHLKNKTYTYVYIEKGDTFDDVIDKINSETIFEQPKAFEWLAKEMKLADHLHVGKFKILNGMSMRQVINLIKYDKQEKVKLVYNYQIHDLDEFISYTDNKLAITSEELEEFVSDENKLKSNFDLDPDNCFAMIIPGTYEVSWAIELEELMKILKERYHDVWNATRLAQAKKMGLKVSEVITLASIVQSESAFKREQEKIAGVYLNRIKKNMPLQADPTLKFANKNFEVQRIINEDKRIKSPYNTYKYKGLPPGPICLVNIQAIDATLNYIRHDFLYFCAKPELNGLSDFSATYDQHRKYANAYQESLSRKRINR